MPAPVLVVLNLKGGVGKTTVAANLSREIYQSQEKKVLLIDLDPQYNLSQQLISRNVYNKLVDNSRDVLRLFEPTPASEFFDINTSSNEPPAPSSIANVLRSFKGNNDISISLIVGSFEITKYSFITDNTKLNHARGFFKHAISLARSEYDLIVIDMNPSSSFLTFCGLSVATDVLSPVKPDKFSVLGLELVKRLIDHPLVEPKPKLHILMNAVKRTSGLTSIEKDIRNTPFFKERILSSRVYQSAVLAALTEHTGFAKDRKVSNKNVIAKELRAVASELIPKLGL